MLVAIGFFGLFSFPAPRALKRFLQVGRQLSLRKKLVGTDYCIFKNHERKDLPGLVIPVSGQLHGGLETVRPVCLQCRAFDGCKTPLISNMSLSKL